MSFTNMVLGGNWDRSEWPDRIEVLHEGAGDQRPYVPERTCRMHRDEHGVWHCSNCDDAERGGEGIVSWFDSWAPDFCPNCGRKVVDE